MAEEFIPTADFSTCLDPFATQEESEQVRIVVLGSKKAIEQVQADFYRSGLADKSQWSKIIPVPTTGTTIEFRHKGSMSILTQQKKVSYGR